MNSNRSLVQDQKRQLAEESPSREDIQKVERQINSRSRSNSYEKKQTNQKYQRHEHEPNYYERKRQRDSSRSPDNRGRGHWESRRIRYMIPMLDGPLVTLRQFMDLQTDRVDITKAESHYLYYKKNWEKRQNEIFVKEHFDEAWFKEKYDPFISESIQNERQIEVKRIADEFFVDYANNVYEDTCLEISEAIVQDIQTTFETNDEQNEEAVETKVNHAHQRVYFNDSFDVAKSPYFGFDPTSRTLFIKTIPKELGRQDIYDIIQKVPGFQSLSISEPVPSQQFQRYGWIVFESEEKCTYACERFKNDCLVINKNELSIVRNSQKRMLKVAQKVSYKKSILDFEAVLKLIASLDAQKGILANPLLEVNPSEFSFKHLDICLVYLRRVHSYCYYSGVQANDERMLSSKCGSVHLRLKQAIVEEEILLENPVVEVQDWQDKVLETANNKINEIEAQKSMLKGVALFKEKLAQKIIYSVQKLMKTENGAWPCIYCTKKFKDSEFVVKHIDNKHSTEEKYLQEIEKMRAITILEMYSVDKGKIMHQQQTKDGSNFPYRPRKYQGGQNQQGGHYKDRQFGHRKAFNGGQHVPFRDLDEPEPTTGTAITNNFSGTINYLEI